MNDKNQNLHLNQPLTDAPSKAKRAVAKKRILEIVNACFESRIDEVFQMADDPDPEDNIAWNNIEEIRWQICGCIGDDLNHSLGEYVEESLLKIFEQSSPDQKTTETPPHNTRF